VIATVFADRLRAGEMLGVIVDGVPVLLANVDGTLVAYRDACAHHGAPLSDGALRGPVVTCRAHGWSFDLRSGCGVWPSDTRLRRVAIELRDGRIYVDPHGPGR
jgi:nitrite reductase/ring-hydroxylating ferredoxin subunit